MQAASPERSPGRLIRAAREAADLTRENLAHETGVSTSTIARLELKDQIPNVLALTRIAGRLGIPVVDLLPEPERVAS